MRIKNYSIAKFNPKTEVILSNEIIENCRYSLSSHGFSVLMGLSQSIDYTREIWPEFEIEITGLFKFLKLREDNGKRYDTVRQAFENILDNPLKIRKSTKIWSGIPWLSYKFDGETSTRVHIKFHEDIMPYLLAFKSAIGISGYTKILPEFCQKFQSKYATWLYPFFKKWQDNKNYKTVIIKKEISWLREKTFTEEEYSKINDWLRFVLNKAIEEVNEKSDLYIRPIDKKNENILSEGKGKAFTHVYFIIDTKKNFRGIKIDEQLKIYHSVEELKKDYSLVEVISNEFIQGLNNYKGQTLKEYAIENKKILVKIDNKYYLCK